MTRMLGAALLVVFVLPTTTAAHRLDEYLQAARLDVARDRIAVELELTPGGAIADHVIASIDGDGDGRMTSAEAHAYGRRVLAETVLELDGRRLPLTTFEISVPAIDEMREGVGAIRINASAAVNPTAGRHGLFYRNDHQPEISVYLVNALKPDARTISIASQRRDPRQREVRFDYDVKNPLGALAWTFGAALMLGGLYSVRGASNGRDKGSAAARVRPSGLQLQGR